MTRTTAWLAGLISALAVALANEPLFVVARSSARNQTVLDNLDVSYRLSVSSVRLQCRNKANGWA